MDEQKTTTMNELYPCFNANVGHTNGHGQCRTLVAIEGSICSWECCLKSVEQIIKQDEVA